jgi:glycosyltransferase involved in cell wall biosynthesis
MRVLFLIQGFEHPASRYRVLQYIDFLRANGVVEKVAVYPKSAEEWNALEEDLEDSDVVFIQKKRMKRREARRVRLSGGAKIVYDVDDAVMFRSSRRKFHKSWRRGRAFARMCGLCDFVIAGNAYLEALARAHNANTAVIPTSIDTALYPVKKFHESAPVTIGWIGGRKSLVFLKELAPVLDEVHRRLPQTQLKIVCNEFFDLAKMTVVKKQWNEREEGADVESFDVGLAPLPDDPWSRGKCATKLLQCMAAGVPCVASAVGVHNEIVKDGENGLLVSTTERWVEALVRLCSDAAPRKSMGRQARLTVERGYSLAASAPKLLAALKKVAATKGPNEKR